LPRRDFPRDRRVVRFIPLFAKLSSHLPLLSLPAGCHPLTVPSPLGSDTMASHRAYSITSDLSLELSPTCLPVDDPTDSCVAADSEADPAPDCTFTPGTPSSCGTNCTYSAGNPEEIVLMDTIASDWRYACDKGHQCALHASVSVACRDTPK
jgi:hypothetical protein